jgi:hypothetical protein
MHLKVNDYPLPQNDPLNSELKGVNIHCVPSGVDGFGG